MCLILLAHDVHPKYSLVLAANRDEFHARPTAPAAFWEDEPDVLGGLDLQSGGTWLAVHRNGRWAAVTNYREGSAAPAELSRGSLVSGFVTTDLSPESYLAQIREDETRFGGYNLLLGEGPEIYWSSNRRVDPAPFQRLQPGIHGVSNHLMNTPWPKVVRGKEAFSELLEPASTPTPNRLLDVLIDKTVAADHLLPTTGVPNDLERALSAPFIETPEYGTRSSTAVLISRDGRIFFAERRFDPAGTITGEDHFEL